MPDLRFTLRQFLKYPGFTTVAVLTLALGIGANTAIFSLVNAVLIQPLPYPSPEQLVQIYETVPNGGRNSVSGGAFKDWRDQNSQFAHLAIYEGVDVNVTGSGAPERMTGMKVSSEFLAVLGVRPILGRDFLAGEDRVGGLNRVLLLTHALWQSRYGADPGVIGRAVSLDQIPYTIVGVLPPRALFRDEPQFLIPTVIDAPGVNWGRAGHFREVIGRLATGRTESQAQAELRGIKQRLSAQYPTFKKDWSVSTVPLQEIYAGRARPVLLVLLGTVALVLLIACANVANLLLARGNARAREMAIRAALGADSWRIIRQLLTESLLLAVAGCLAGLVVAVFGIRILATLVGDLLPQFVQPSLNLNVLGFSVLVAGGCGLLFGILPAWRASRPELNQDLKESERGSSSASRSRTQSLLVVSEFAFTLVLLVGAGLFLRSFVHLLRQDPGFDPRQILAFDLSFPAAKYPRTADRLHFVHGLTEKLKALPGVESIGTINDLPLSRGGLTEMASRADRPRTDYVVACNYVGGDYFNTMGIRLVRGRLLAEADNRTNAVRAVVVDAGMVRDLYPNEDPLGGSLNFLGNRWEIVGVVESVRQFGLNRDPRPTLYAAQAFSIPSTSIALRSGLPPLTLVESVRRTILETDPDQPMANIRTLEEAVHQSLSTQRASLILLGSFAALAIGLACLGIYGVMSHAIAQRARELCIRAALGAGQGEIMRLVLAGGMKPSALGIGVGLVAAFGLARVLESQLYQVEVHDPLVYGGAVALLVVVAALSVLLPARRAASLDPVKVLRHE